MSSTEPKTGTTPLGTLCDAAWRDIVEAHSERGGYPIPDLFNHLRDAVEKAHALGVEEARAEAALVTDAMQQVHEDRMSVLNTTITAALLEHLQVDEVTVNPDNVATVHRRVKLSSRLNPDNTITYTLEKLTQ